MERIYFCDRENPLPIMKVDSFENFFPKRNIKLELNHRVQSSRYEVKAGQKIKTVTATDLPDRWCSFASFSPSGPSNFSWAKGMKRQSVLDKRGFSTGTSHWKPGFDPDVKEKLFLITATWILDWFHSQL